MNIVCSKLYEEQLKEILNATIEEEYEATKKFKTYLDTIIINIPTKVNKYKKSLYFDDENIKDVEFQGCTIPFFIDEENSCYVILGIIKNC